MSVAGLITMVLPAIRAAMDFHAGIAIGKFQGVTNAHTPTGWRTHIANLFGQLRRGREAEEAPPFPAARKAMSIASWTSPARLGEDLPHLARHEPRELFLVALQDLAGGIEDLGAARGRRVRQPGNAFFAAATAASTSSGPLFGKDADEVVPVRGVPVLEGPAGRRGDPLSADEVLSRRDRPLGGHQDSSARPRRLAGEPTPRPSWRRCPGDGPLPR